MNRKGMALGKMLAVTYDDGSRDSESSARAHDDITADDIDELSYDDSFAY